MLSNADAENAGMFGGRKRGSTAAALSLGNAKSHGRGLWRERLRRKRHGAMTCRLENHVIAIHVIMGICGHVPGLPLLEGPGLTTTPLPVDDAIGACLTENSYSGRPTPSFLVTREMREDAHNAASCHFAAIRLPQFQSHRVERQNRVRNLATRPC